VLNLRDQAHARAVAHAARFQGEMVTTTWVLTELGDAMCAPANRLEFVATLRDLQANSQFRIVPPDAALFEEGVNLFEARPDKEWSLTDCISFVVVTQERITEALTGDHHFEQAGVRCPPQVVEGGIESATRTSAPPGKQ
jgi:predicted nucleic acid-binding protein